MWITRATLADLLARKDAELEKERAKVVLLERALASAQANVDWMRVLTNQLSMDRAAIAASRGIDLPAPTLTGTLQTAADIARRVESGGGPNVDPAEVAAATVGRALAEDDVDAALAAYGGVVQGFEDVGDDEAEAQGIHHADDGTVEYAKR